MLEFLNASGGSACWLLDLGLALCELLGFLTVLGGLALVEVMVIPLRLSRVSSCAADCYVSFAILGWIVFSRTP